MSEFNIDDLDAVISDAGSSLVQMLALQLRKELSKGEQLEAQVKQLAAENSAMKQIVDSVTDLSNEPQYHAEGMGCGLEDRGITDRYEAMRHGWDEAMERVYGEVIPCAEELETPATNDFLDEVRAQGVEMLLDVYRSRWISPHVEDADRFAAQLRKGGAA